MPFTISRLPASLSLVHIPRSRLPQLSNPILRQILQPTPSFLNVTSNEIEVSLFIEHHMLNDFEQIARHDRHHYPHRSTSASSPSRSLSPESIEISYENWSVLQIDSHSDDQDNSGARVHELSAPLAAAGISILYQSSYMSDFIFVKEVRIKEVMALFASAGFDLHPQDSNVLTSLSPPLSPISPDHFTSDIALESIIMQNRDVTSSLPSILEQVHTQRSLTHSATSLSSTDTIPSIPIIPAARTKSHSPLAGDVRLLLTDLACVGLSDNCLDNWGLKIVKLVAFPELIPLPARSPSTFSRPQKPPSPISPSITRGRSFSSISSSSDEDGYFSHPSAGTHSTSPPPTSAASHSCSDLTKISTNVSSTSKHRIVSLPSLSPITDDKEPQQSHSKSTSSQPSPRLQRNRDNLTKVPFFSFTRTQEGSSLTTDVLLLAALFPPHERHMVICSGELDAADRDTNNADASDNADSDDDDGNSTLRCLQVDLRRFGLDKHGLVSRFSRVLEENGVNHMYSSTFKTANLLVDKKKSIRAQSLLRSC